MNPILSDLSILLLIRVIKFNVNLNLYYYYHPSTKFDSTGKWFSQGSVQGGLHPWGEGGLYPGPPQSDTMGYGQHMQAVHMLLECILVCATKCLT